MKYESIKKYIKTNRHYIYLLAGLITFFIHTENTIAQTFCLTPESTNNASFENDIQNLNAMGPFYLKIYVHVIRNGQGMGGQSEQDVYDALAFLDQDFTAHDIFFIWDCQIDYIDDDGWYAGPADGIFNVNNHFDGIDIYLFPADIAATGGRANGVGSSSEFWVSGTWDGIPVAQSHIISHEMGHVINLWHTHHGCESGGIWEAPDGSNCSTAGDFVCDTPADPFMQFDVDPITCEWSGVAYCSPPEPASSYNPDEAVIMAYTYPACMSYFTEGQGRRMRNSIESLPYLQATLTTDPQGDCLDNSEGCESDLTLNGIIDGGLYEAANTITSTGTIATAQSVTYQAGNSILLEDVFFGDGKNGSVFLGTIEECTSGFTGSPAGSSLVQKPASAVPQQTGVEMPFSIRNYPNPFVRETTIEFILEHDAPTTLIIFDAMGQQLETLIDREQRLKGTHQVIFDGRDYPAGMYYYTLQVGNQVTTDKMILMRNP